MKFLLILAKTFKEKKLNFSLSSLVDMKTRFRVKHFVNPFHSKEPFAFNYFIASKFRGHFNFAVFWDKIAFRGILISWFRQIDEFRGF